MKRLLLPVLGAALAATCAVATSQSRAIDHVVCEFDEPAGALRVTETHSEGSLVRRIGDRVAALQPNGIDGGYEEVACGGVATVANVDLIEYRVRSDGITDARLSLRGGELAPGRTSEGPTSEIETKFLILRRATEPEVSIEAGPGNQTFIAGQRGTIAAVNLNAASEAADPDADVTVTRAGRVTFDFATGAGDDVLDLRGAAEVGKRLEPRFAIVRVGDGADIVRSAGARVYVVATSGHDILRLGNRGDFVEAGRGDDDVSSGGGADLLLPGPGRDRVRAGAGDDEILGASGGADLVDCGPGRDRVSAGPRDRLRRCERIRRTRERPTVRFAFD